MTGRRSGIKNTPEDIKANIRQRYASGKYTYAQLARMYNLAETTIGYIIRQGDPYPKVHMVFMDNGQLFAGETDEETADHRARAIGGYYASIRITKDYR